MLLASKSGGDKKQNIRELSSQALTVEKKKELRQTCTWICSPLRPPTPRCSPVLTSHVHAIIVKILTAVVARLLLRVWKHAESLTHLLELLLLFFLHLRTSSTVSVWRESAGGRGTATWAQTLPVLHRIVKWSLKHLGDVAEPVCGKLFWSPLLWRSCPLRALCSNLSACFSSTPAGQFSGGACVLENPKNLTV